jgi:hypothetical protein
MQKLPPMNWFTRVIPSLVPALALAFGTLVARAGEPAAVAAPLAAGEVDPAKIRQYVYDMEKAYGHVRDYTTTFHKQERVDGELLPAEEIELKFRKQFSVYMRWTGTVNQTREVIYVDGWNGNKLRAHKGSFPDMTVNLRPDSNMAMQGNRHKITEAHFGHAISVIVRDARLAESRPQDRVRYVDLGERVVYGARSRCFEARAQSSGPVSVYYAARAKVCFDTRTKMPTRIQVWSADGDLLEDYGYENTKLNVGLTDADFDPENADYNF